MSKFQVKKIREKGYFWKKKISSFNRAWKNILCRLLPPSVGQKLWLLCPFKEGKIWGGHFFSQWRPSHGHSKYRGSQAAPYQTPPPVTCRQIGGRGGGSVGHLPLAGVHHGVIARDASLVQGVLKKVVQSGNPKTKHLSILKLQTFELTTIAHVIL